MRKLRLKAVEYFPRITLILREGEGLAWAQGQVF